MEIPKAWDTQFLVGQKPLDEAFTSSEISATLDNGTRALSTLGKMSCVGRVGPKDKEKGRDVRPYKRIKNPGDVCSGCFFEQSGSSGCILKHPNMRKEANIKVRVQDPIVSIRRKIAEMEAQAQSLSASFD